MHEKLLNEPGALETTLGDDRFTLQFNRVRRKGRGWALAGFEILEAKRIDAETELAAAGAAGAAPEAPKFELVSNDEYANAFDREVSSRLL